MQSATRSSAKVLARHLSAGSSVACARSAVGSNTPGFLLYSNSSSSSSSSFRLNSSSSSLLFSRNSTFSTSSFSTPSATTTTPPPTTTTTSSSSTPAFGIYPGGKQIAYTSTLDTHPPADSPTIPIFRIMDEEGNIRPDAVSHMGALEQTLDRDGLVKAYTSMVRILVMDSVLYDSQRQGRISFYMTNGGEEATHIGSAMALQAEDEVFAQYREVGVLLWRGYTLQEVCDQCFGNSDDKGKGRQMPVHYGSNKHHFQTISSPLCTQLPQAVGAAYFNKLQGNGKIAVCYFGEGAASEGDFHAALNMSTTQEAPVVFFCRNNGFAISTPVKDQYRGDGIAARGIAYGMHTIRVDGNDFFAVYLATLKARSIALGLDDGSGNTKPVLIEAMTYREGHHSTSDDSTRYRKAEEIQQWRTMSNPIKRLRAYLERKGWWSADAEASLVAEERRSILTALSAAETKGRPAPHTLFEDVYGDAKLPQNLAEQSAQLQEHMAAYPTHYVGAGHHQ